MQSWFKSWQLNGFNRIHVKQKLLRNAKRTCRSSWRRQGSQKSFTQTIHWNLTKAVKTYPGITVRQLLTIARLHHTDQKQIGLLREQCAKLKKGHLLYCCNQVWMKHGGRIPWNANAICETFKIFCLMGKHRMKGDLKNRFKGPILPFGSLGKYHPVSTKDQSRIHKFCKTVLSDIFIGYVLYVGWIWMERKHYGCGPWGAGKAGRIWNPREKTQCERGDNVLKWSQMEE